MSANTLIAIHGNLQQPAVWERFRGALRDANGQALELVAEDLWASEHLANGASAGDAFTQWAVDFCKRAEGEAQAKRPWLLGYSLGGRLALHALLQQPTLWRGAIIVAAHTGLSDVDEKAARLQHDRCWAERFRAEPWGKLITEWDAQAVFGGRMNPQPPQESDFDRACVAQCFDAFSLGRQRDLLPELAATDAAGKLPPVLYLSGEDDVKFTAIGQRLAADCPSVTHKVIPDCGHRVPWENPANFAQAAMNFIEANW